MADSNSTSSDQPLFSAELNPAELEEILRRIDENLALRPILPGQPTGESGLETAAPPLPGWPDLAWRLQEIRQRQSPYFVVNGPDLANQLRRLLNLPLRVFGRKQAYFNGEALDVLGEIVAQLQALRAQAEYHARVAQDLAQLRERVSALEAQLAKQPPSPESTDLPSASHPGPIP